MARKNQLDPTAYNALVGFDGDWRDSWWNQDYLEMTANRLALSNVRTILDLGCGIGHWGLRIAALCHPDAHLHGVDRESSFLERARTKAAGRRATFTELHGEDLVSQFGPDAFDLVTCQTVLMHVEDPAAVLAQMVAVLRPGGVLLAAEPDNSANTISSVAQSQRDRNTLLKAMELRLVCRDGKKALGHGDEDVGVEMVSLMHDAGLVDIDCRSNDRCAFMIPPYDEPKQRLELQNTKLENEGMLREVMRSRYLAGGGDPDRFETLWAAAWALMRDRHESLQRGDYVNAGGFMHYLVSARKAPVEAAS